MTKHQPIELGFINLLRVNGTTVDHYCRLLDANWSTTVSDDGMQRHTIVQAIHVHTVPEGVDEKQFAAWIADHKMHANRKALRTGSTPEARRIDYGKKKDLVFDTPADGPVVQSSFSMGINLNQAEGEYK